MNTQTWKKNCLGMFPPSFPELLLKFLFLYSPFPAGVEESRRSRRMSGERCPPPNMLHKHMTALKVKIVPRKGGWQVRPPISTYIMWVWTPLMPPTLFQGPGTLCAYSHLMSGPWHPLYSLPCYQIPACPASTANSPACFSLPASSVNHEIKRSYSENSHMLLLPWCN